MHRNDNGARLLERRVPREGMREHIVVRLVPEVAYRDTEVVLGPVGEKEGAEKKGATKKAPKRRDKKGETKKARPKRREKQGARQKGRAIS